MDINCLPDSILLLVFHKLDVKDVVSSSAVSSRWNEICKDQLLWKNLFELDYIKNKSHLASCKNSLKIADHAESWKNEYIRLYYNHPIHETKILYQDEIIYFEFSHDGSKICACTRDNILVRWNKENDIHFELLEELDVGNNFNLEISIARFSPSDEKILVAGFNIFHDNTEIIILCSRDESVTILGKLSFSSQVITACWLTNELFIVAEDNRTEENFYDESFHSMCYSLTSCMSWKESSRVAPLGNVKKLNKFLKYPGVYYRQSMNGNELSIFLKQQKVPEVEVDKMIMEKNCFSSTSTISKQPWAVFSVGKSDLYVDRIGFHQLSQERLKKDGVATKPDYELDMKGEIVAMSISPDKEILFVNVRGMFDIEALELQSKQNNLKECDAYFVIKMINLNTFQDIGHFTFYKDKEEMPKAGLSLPPLYSNYLGISKNYIASVSEDGDVYVWDRNYSILLSKIKMSNVSWCINFVAFDPENEEMLLVADSVGLTISYSKNLRSKFTVLV